MALEKTRDRYGNFTMKPSNLEMTETRFLIEVRKGETINVVWSATSPSKESELLPIRIPPTKGLLGFRIALIRSEQQPMFDKVRKADDLRRLKFGLGVGWGDVDIFQALTLFLSIFL